MSKRDKNSSSPNNPNRLNPSFNFITDESADSDENKPQSPLEQKPEMPKQEDSSNLTEKSVLQKEFDRIETKTENSRNRMNFLIQKKTYIEKEKDAPESSTKNESNIRLELNQTSKEMIEAINEFERDTDERNRLLARLKNDGICQGRVQTPVSSSTDTMNAIAMLRNRNKEKKSSGVNLAPQGPSMLAITRPDTVLTETMKIRMMKRPRANRHNTNLNEDKGKSTGGGGEKSYIGDEINNENSLSWDNTFDDAFKNPKSNKTAKETKDENLPIKQEEKFNNAYGYQLIQETDESSEKSNQDDYMKNENSLYRDNEYFKLANKKDNEDISIKFLLLMEDSTKKGEQTAVFAIKHLSREEVIKPMLNYPIRAETEFVLRHDQLGSEITHIDPTMPNIIFRAKKIYKEKKETDSNMMMVKVKFWRTKGPSERRWQFLGKIQMNFGKCSIAKQAITNDSKNIFNFNLN